MGCVMGDMEHGMLNTVFGTLLTGHGMLDVACGLWDAGHGMLDMGCGMWHAECGIWGRGTQDAMLNVVCGM